MLKCFRPALPQSGTVVTMGAIWWGSRRTCPPTFFLRFCVSRGFKTKCYDFQFLCEEFFMLDVAHSYLDVESEFCVVSLALIILQIFTSKMIFSILQVSRGRERFLTASVWHLSSVVYCKKWHCLETVKYNGYARKRPQYSRDLFRAKTLADWFYCNVGCNVFRNKQRKI